MSGVHDDLGVDNALVAGVGGEVVGHLFSSGLVADETAHPVESFQEVGQVVHVEEPIHRPGWFLIDNIGEFGHPIGAEGALKMDVQLDLGDGEDFFLAERRHV